MFASSQQPRLLDLAFGSVVDGVIVVGGHDHHVYLNPACRKLLQHLLPAGGLLVEDIVRLPLRHLDGSPVLPEEAPFQRALMGEDVVDSQLTLVRPDGTNAYFSINANPIKAENGELFGAIATFRDITANRQMEEAYQQSEDRFRSVIEQSLDGVILIDETGTIIEWNQGQERITGLKREMVIGRPAVDVHFQVLPNEMQTPEKYASAKAALLGIFQTGRAPWANNPQEAKIQRPDGQYRIIQDLTFPIHTGKRTLICSICRDVTEVKYMEEQLGRAQRLQMVGRVAAQVAHDFNNLLGPLVGYPELIKSELPPGHPAIRFCDTMLFAAKQMADINADLLTLGRRVHFNQEPTDLNRLVKETIDQELPVWEGNLNLELHLAQDLLSVNGSGVQLFRVLANLISNAREAMGRAGVLEIRTANTYVEAATARLHHVDPGIYVKLVVSDSGAGIPEENIGRVFEPFFTTKLDSQRRGSGLGLSVVQAIVEDHRGYVTVESVVGAGSTFSVYLPADQKSTVSKPPEKPSRGAETILIVDDDELLREMFALILGELGYQVQHVSCGEEAVAQLKEQPADLLILDMVMPGGIDGAETYRQAKEICPDQRAIIVSGYAESERVQEALRLGAGRCLSKPLTMDELGRAVEREMARTI